ncbi:iron reductase domain protein [Glonium stellatum]|uniref:Iron reductase domain protein n=1 Tax=Glonium stellatum TaxID=574774 RepID=A0A8E2JYN5_9PEZI|nr:iron reductase domain protein [Glonium stellatum]
MKLSTLLPFALAAATSAQTTSSYTDPKSSITFQAFTDPTSGYTFGLALPMTPTTDFIGILVGKGSGWVGASLGGSMVNKLLIAAWPNGNQLVSSFRKATSYANPPEATGAFSMTPIAKGTYINSTHFSYTFLCKACILADGTTFTANATSGVLGWALSTAAPSTKSSHSSALNRHSAQGNFGVQLSAAMSNNYDQWAAMAAAPSPSARAFTA